MVRYFHCRSCGRIQEWTSRCAKCGSLCNRVRVKGEWTEVIALTLGFALLYLGGSGLYLKTRLYELMGNRDMACNIVFLMYFLMIISVLSFSIFLYTRSRKQAEQKVKRWELRNDDIYRPKHYERVELDDKPFYEVDWETNEDFEVYQAQRPKSRIKPGMGSYNEYRWGTTARRRP